MGDVQRQAIIERAIGTWLDRVSELRPELDVCGWCNECLDMAGEPRLRAEERAAVVEAGEVMKPIC